MFGNSRLIRAQRAGRTPDCVYFSKASIGAIFARETESAESVGAYGILEKRNTTRETADAIKAIRLMQSTPRRAITERGEPMNCCSGYGTALNPERPGYHRQVSVNMIRRSRGSSQPLIREIREKCIKTELPTL